jgi:serine/threonine protein kinase
MSVKTSNHPNLVQVLSAISDEEDEKMWVVMEYCNGMDMEQYIKSNKQTGNVVCEYKAIQILNEILAGLLTLHENSIWHRDMKPANVIISNGVFKLCDYGMVRMVTCNPYSKRDFT